MLESLDFSSLLQCRMVSKSWEKEATVVVSKQCKIIFDSIDAVQNFLSMSPRTSEETLFAHVNFKFEVEAAAVAEKEFKALQTFLQNHTKNLQSVETPEGSICGLDSVNEWTSKVLCSLEPKPLEETPAEIIVDENANYVEMPSADANSLQEIVINDEIEIEETQPKSDLTIPRKQKTVHFSMVENPEYVSIPYSDEGYANFAEFYPYYLGEHSNERGRQLHILGITNCIILIFIGTFTLTPILYAVAIVQAYALALGAHYFFDKHIPRSTIRNPIYIVSSTFYN